MFDKKLIFKIVGYVLFLGIGVFFLQKTLQDQDLHMVLGTLLNTKLEWIALVVVISVVGHIIRALRWQLIIKSSGHQVSITSIFHSLLFGYFINYLVPRLGEITRCMSLKKASNVPATKLFGTVLVERMIDVTTLFVVLPTVFFMQYDRFSGLINKYVMPWVIGVVDKVIANKWIALAAVVAIIVGFISLDKKMQQKEKEEGGMKWMDELWEGILTIKKIQNIPLLVLYSLLIWGYYFATNYLCLFALDSSLQEKWSAALATGAFGSIGRSLPIAGGGMGAYHFIIAQVLLQFGVTGVFATSMAIIFHGVQMVFHIVVGAIGGIWLGIKKSPTT